MTEKKMSIDAGKELYEIGVHFVASLAEKQAQEEFKTLQDNLNKKAEIVSSTDLDLIDLAYTMVTTIDRKNERFDSAYFGTITFISTPDQITNFDSELSGNESILRHIIVKTVPEAAEALTICQELVKEEEDDEEVEDESKPKKESSQDNSKKETSKKEDSQETTDAIDEKIDEIVS